MNKEHEVQKRVDDIKSRVKSMWRFYFPDEYEERYGESKQSITDRLRKTNK